jgi:lipoprotein-releasing system ATP-binding protein
MGDAAPVLRLERVVKEYGREVVVRVLHGVSLTLARGELAALVGPSGSGKSTLLNLMGLLDRPTSGSVEVAGEDASGLDTDTLARHRARTLGFVFQFHHLMPGFSAVENVLLPLAADHGRVAPWMAERARQVLAEVGLAHQAGKRPAQLSGGEQQRVALARALVASPALVLADEPTGNLDTRTSDEVFAAMRRFHRERGTTFLVVTHDRRLAARCDRVLELVDGRIVSDRREPAAEATP